MGSLHWPSAIIGAAITVPCRTEVAMLDEIKLTDLEDRVFRAWEGMDPDYSGLSFRAVSQRSGVPLPKIRSAVRRLARKGLVEFQRGMMTEDGTPAGSGYSLTDEGDRVNRELVERAMAGPLSNPQQNGD